MLVNRLFSAFAGKSWLNRSMEIVSKVLFGESARLSFKILCAKRSAWRMMSFSTSSANETLFWFFIEILRVVCSDDLRRSAAVIVVISCVLTCSDGRRFQRRRKRIFHSIEDRTERAGWVRPHRRSRGTAWRKTSPRRCDFGVIKSESVDWLVSALDALDRVWALELVVLKEKRRGEIFLHDRGLNHSSEKHEEKLIILMCKENSVDMRLVVDEREMRRPFALTDFLFEDALHSVTVRFQLTEKIALECVDGRGHGVSKWI